MGDIEVLFNVRVLSTGVDLPSVRIVVLTAATSSVEEILSVGDELFVDSGQQDKRGILAIVTRQESPTKIKAGV